MATNEFDEWAKRFEARRVVEWRGGKKLDYVVPESCMYAVREGPHKTACNREAKGRSNGYPVCRNHLGRDVRGSWRGFMEGA